MKNLVGILVFLGAINSFAGTIECHDGVVKQRNVTELRAQGLFSVSAFTINSCETNLVVRIRGVNVDSPFLTFKATRNDDILGVPVPVILNTSDFLRVGKDTIEIRNNQLQVGDTLFLREATSGHFGFVIQ